MASLRARFRGQGGDVRVASRRDLRQLDADGRDCRHAKIVVTVADDATPVRNRRGLALAVRCTALQIIVVAVERAAAVHCVGAHAATPDAAPIAARPRTTILRKLHRIVHRRPIRSSSQLASIFETWIVSGAVQSNTEQSELSSGSVRAASVTENDSSSAPQAVHAVANRSGSCSSAQNADSTERQRLGNQEGRPGRGA
jgi:hypothetical protein